MGSRTLSCTAQLSHKAHPLVLGVRLRDSWAVSDKVSTGHSCRTTYGHPVLASTRQCAARNRVMHCSAVFHGKPWTQSAHRCTQETSGGCPQQGTPVLTAAQR
jgi:hypothetical protein